MQSPQPMMTHHALDQLRTLRLTGMADALTEQLTQPGMSAMGLEERLALLVDREILTSVERRYGRPQHKARLKAPTHRLPSRTRTRAPAADWTGLASPAWCSATGS